MDFGYSVTPGIQFRLSDIQNISIWIGMRLSYVVTGHKMHRY